MINKAKELNLAIKKTNLAKEYLSLKELILNDEYTASLLEVIKQTQNEAKEYLKNNDLKNYQASNNTLKVLKEEFFASPLISNYISIKDEMHRFLEQIVNILSE